MEWLFEHGESVATLGTIVFAFISWNVAQSIGLRNAREEFRKFREQEFKEYKVHISKQFEFMQSEISALRAQQDVVMKTLSEELRRIGEKLAHIEGFLTAERQAGRK